MHLIVDDSRRMQPWISSLQWRRRRLGAPLRIPSKQGKENKGLAKGVSKLVFPDMFPIFPATP